MSSKIYRKKSDGKSEAQILGDLVEALTQAVGASSQLVHLGGHPVYWMSNREALEMVKALTLRLAPQNLMMAPKEKKLYV